MPPIPGPSTPTSSFLPVASVPLERFKFVARDWPDDENDPGNNPRDVDRWVIVSIVFILLLFMILVGGYTCVAYYRRTDRDNLESQNEDEHQLTLITPTSPSLPAIPSPTLSRSR